MCACELHYNSSGHRCTCHCRSHQAYRDTDRREAERQSAAQRLADAEAEVKRLRAEVCRLNGVISSRIGGAR